MIYSFWDEAELHHYLSYDPYSTLIEKRVMGSHFFVRSNFKLD